MGVISEIKKIVKSSGNMPLSLKEAIEFAPEDKGCFRIYYKGMKLKFVGKANENIKNKLENYYNGKYKKTKAGREIYRNKEDLKVIWKVADSKAECDKMEEKWLKDLRPIWNS